MPRKSRRRPPTHPGVYIARGLLEDYGLTQQEVADALGVSRRSVNQLVNGKRAVTAVMALRLGKLTKTSPEFWLNLQMAVDLWRAEAETGGILTTIKPLHPTKAA
ncbi:MAG: HigA family addiction module antitoxin [Kiloniellaceae bacterium]